MIKYKAMFKYNKVKKVEVVRQTTCFNVIKPNSYPREIKEKKEMRGWYSTYDTFDEAKQSLIDFNKQKLFSAERSVQYATANLKLSEALTEKDLT